MYNLLPITVTVCFSNILSRAIVLLIVLQLMYNANRNLCEYIDTCSTNKKKNNLKNNPA